MSLGGFDRRRVRLGRTLIGIEICRLQGRWGGLTGVFRSGFLAALYTLAHPFTHVQAFNTDGWTGAMSG